MLRRRILASAMASVMALSSVAVIANADETKTTKDKADLKALVESYEEIRNKDIYEKGSVSAERFLGALEYAENVLADINATAKDYTAAYLMVEALANMDSYTAAQLADLIKKWQGVYYKQNILNDEIGDAEYNEDKFTDFENAFTAAEKLVNSDDVRLTTDAFIDLQDAADALMNSKKTGVKKSEFRSVLQAYEATLAHVNDFDGWRRGNFSHSKVAWGATKTLRFDLLKKAVHETGVVVDIKGDSWDVLELGSKKNFNGTPVTDNVREYIKNQYDEFDKIKSATYTTNDEILAAYNTCKLATELYNAWTVDTTTRANKAKVDALLKQYHSQIVAQFRTSAAEALFTDVLHGTLPAEDWTDAANKYANASLKSPARITITVDADGYYDPDGTKNVVVAKNSDILRFVKVTSADVTDKNLKFLMGIVEDYAAGNYDDDVYGLDWIGQVKVANGSVTEYTLIHRALNYILTDMYPAYSAPSSKKLSELEEQIKRAYELANLTGDAAIFNENHMATVSARKTAILFVAEYKAYGDDATVTTADGTFDSIDGMFNFIKGKNDDLENQWNNYKYSYGEVRDEMYAVAQDLDSGAIKDVAKITELLKKVAKDLSILDAQGDDNEAFTKDRIFQPINRLHTGATWGDEKTLTDDFEALKAAVKADKEASQVVKGDVNGDGKVTAADATEILKAVIGLRDAVAVEVGDMNGDGAVTSADATEILKAQIGL